MKLKQAILILMDRDTLKAVVDDLGIEGVDRRSVEEMRAGVSRSRRAEVELLLAHLNEKQVKAVCEQMDVSPKGRRKELMERLLNTTGTEEQLPAKPSLPPSVKAEKPNSNKAQKESPPMADKQNNGSQNELQPAPVRLPEPPACASHADRPPGMMRVTRTELVWPGKYNEDGTLREVPRVSLPFQVIETVNETRATREAKKGGIQPGLFDIYEGKEGDSFEEGWKNKLIWGDNLLVMGSLLEKFAGKIDLIYKDFVIPNTEIIPKELRAKVKKWSDYIDYRAVDWDFQNDTFMQGWVAFRTRKERKLPLVSDPHAYDKPGRYRILVKVIDIFGNDTSQALDVEVPQ
jgi:hypothetical protein